MGAMTWAEGCFHVVVGEWDCCVAVASIICCWRLGSPRRFAPRDDIVEAIFTAMTLGVRGRLPGGGRVGSRWSWSREGWPHYSFS